MKADMNDLKKLVNTLMESGISTTDMAPESQHMFNRLFRDSAVKATPEVRTFDVKKPNEAHIEDTEEVFEESLSIQDNEIELIKKALEKYNGKRKNAADELGISGTHSLPLNKRIWH